MDSPQRRVAKEYLIAGMLRGQPWQEAAAQADLQISQATAYRLLSRFRTQGAGALEDGRHGHASKLREPVRQWLAEYCRARPACTSRTAQTALFERFGVRVSITHLNRVRAALGVSRCSQGLGKNRSRSLSEPLWQEGAGSLLLLAAAQETGLLTALEGALPINGAVPHRLARTTPKTRRQSLLTLLFLPAVELRRTCDLRHYTGDALALLTGRRRAYGFWWVERFLSEVARAGGAETLTDALAAWTARLWLSDKVDPDQPVPAYYVDGHKKPVYSDHLIPRGLVGRTGKVLGCRGLVLLHDAAGHPLLATTHRGDVSLKEGVPPLVTRYEQAAERAHLMQLVVDREGMAAEWLAGLAAQRRTVVTVLRADQYQGLTSFSEVGPFVPLRRDRQGRVTRDVASARYSLPLPDHPGQRLPLWVALVRDWTRQVPVPASKADRVSPPRWDADLEWKAGWWWDADWVATPSPAPPAEPKLVPIVTTAPFVDATALAETYTHRWPAQENSLRDWLLAVGLDINHGYHSTPVENSEVTKRQAALQRRLERLQRWAQGARERTERASRLYTRRCQETKAHADHLYRLLTDHQQELLRQGVDRDEVRTTIRREQREADAEIAEYEQRQWQAYETSNAEHRKCERYCHQQREVLRALEDLAASERPMYELDQRKDQVMTAFKLAFVNLVMWVRQQYFPATFAQATWHRLVPFFRLPGRVIWRTDTVEVALRPFNDRRLNWDLAAVCVRVSAALPRLPDGNLLRLALESCDALVSCEGGGQAQPGDGQNWREATGGQTPYLASGDAARRAPCHF